MRHFFITVGLTLVSLLPAVLLFYLFDGNEAAVTAGGETMKFGGPIAAFVGVFLLVTHVYNGIASTNPNLPSLIVEKVRPLAGTWDIESVSHGSSKDARRSEVLLETTDTGISLSGGSFESAGTGAQASELLGQWECEKAFSDGRRLVYIYSVTEAGPGKGTTRGIVDAVLSGSDCFKGTWATIGPDYHSGTITLRKRKAAA